MAAVLVQLGGHRPGHAVRGWAQIDEEDAPEVLRYRWSLIDGYATRAAMVGGKQRMVRMHRQILGLEQHSEYEADHINRDRLDNRRANLRAIPHELNCQNVPAQAREGCTSRFRGVRRNRHRWQAAATVNGRFHHLGCFDDELEAAEVARAFRVAQMAGAVD